MSLSLFDDPMWDISRWLDEPWMQTDFPRTRSVPSECVEVRPQPRRAGRPWQPRLDIVENSDENQVTAMIELPGLKREDIHVDVQNNRVIVSGEYAPLKDVEDKAFVHRERPTGKFNRALTLPSGVKPSDVHARYENGVLYVTYPRTHKGSTHRLTID